MSTPPRLRIIISLLAVIIAGTTAGGLLTGHLGIVLAGVVIGAHAAAIYATATRRGWDQGARIIGLVTGAGATGAAGALDGPLWALPAALITLFGWFIARTLRRYLRPAAALPAALVTRIEQFATFSDDAIAGLRIGARSDGAVVAVGYVRRASDTRQRTRFQADVEAARGLLRNGGISTPTFIGLVDDDTHFERDGDVIIAGAAHLATAVGAAQAPAVEDVLKLAADAGLTLNRAQQRAVRSQQRGGNASTGSTNRPTGAAGNTSKKIVHRGRVTKVEQ